jgi:hypothetical protein
MAQRFEVCGETCFAGTLSLLLAVCGLLLLVAGARAQSPGLAQVAITTAEDALHELAQQADVIFAGQVTAVRRRTATVGATGIVEIDFAVEDAVRGIRGGQYTLREWSGLWTAGATPFRVGQRYLMLLHTPGASGLSSPVGGEDGAIPICGSGAAAVPGTVDAAPDSQPVSNLMDLRWIATRVTRPIEYVWVPVREPILRPFGPSPMHMAPPASEVRLPVATFTEPASQAAAYPAVLAMLRGWQKEEHAAR